MSRFVGTQRIENQVEDGDYVVLTFKDGSSSRLSKKMFSISATRESTDLTNLWERQLSPVVKDILQTLLDWDVQLGQLDYLLNLLKTSIEHNNSKAQVFPRENIIDKNKAQAILWNKKLDERTISDIDRVLKSVENKTNGRTEREN